MRLLPVSMKTRARTKAQPESFEIRIEKLVYGGFGLGRRGGKVVFVPFSLPGDRLLVRTLAEKKTFTRARIVKILEPGPGRVEPPCPYFGSCGGCQWQHLDYARQVDAKREILEGIFHHRFPETRELLIGMKASTRDYGYRSRARFQVRGCGPDARVGFFRSQSHDVEDIHSCPLLQPTLNSGLESIRRSCREASNPGPPEIELACVEDMHSWEAARLSADSDEAADSYQTDGKRDPPVLERRIGEYTVVISPAAFFQANDFMLAELVASVMDQSGADANRPALDLFCGVGLFTLPLARRFKEVEGVDSSALACELAHRNVAAAGFGNVRITCSSVEEWIESPTRPFDLIVLDPPRVGAGPEVMTRISQLSPEAIVYVSCDPQTLARDVSLLPPGQYRIDSIQGLDLFPQTFHFETVLKLQRAS